jgi:hypothetical protein
MVASEQPATRNCPSGEKVTECIPEAFGFHFRSKAPVCAFHWLISPLIERRDSQRSSRYDEFDFYILTRGRDLNGITITRFLLSDVDNRIHPDLQTIIKLK